MLIGIGIFINCRSAFYPHILLVPAGLLAGVFTHGWIGHAGVNMGDLLPQMLGRPAHVVLIRGMFGDVAPMVAAALFAEQLLKPLVA